MRFRFNDTFQSIEDTLTGETYLCGSEEICTLLNEVNDKADRNAEDVQCCRNHYYDLKSKHKEMWNVLKKYEIDSVEKLDRILFEQRVW